MSHRLLAAEVIQTSAMDCGPAALKCLLEGFGIHLSYGRLREACQTDVDGTSIDTLEDVAVQLGLDAEQVMVPADHLLLAGSGLLPAMIVTRLPNGLNHFLVAWRRHGPFLQVMDPATRRRWPTGGGFLNEMYMHVQPVPAAAWREWAGSSQFLEPLAIRLRGLGFTAAGAERAIGKAASDATMWSVAALDASARMVASIVRSGGLKRGGHAAAVLEHFAAGNRRPGMDRPGDIPQEYWTARPAAPGTAAEEQVLLCGAVLLRVRGRLEARSSAPEHTEREPAPARAIVSPELSAALTEEPTRPERELLKLLRGDGLLAPAALLAALALAASGVIVEAMLFRGLFDLGRDLVLTTQRLGAMGAIVVFATALLLLDIPIALGVLRLGRHLEARLRIAFLEKIPRLADCYFRSRLTSDMAERSHSAHHLRILPEMGAQLTRSVFELLLTAAGIAWIDPGSAYLALLAAAASIGLPLLAQPTLTERDLRVRSHLGGLSRFYLDGLLGLVPVRAHGAERSVRREHEGLLVEWARAGFGLQRAVVAVESAQLLSGFGLAALLLLGHLARGGESGGALLLVYWALSLPLIGEDVALVAWQYPAHRNRTLRLLEPLGAAEDSERAGAAGQDLQPEHGPAPVTKGVAVELKQVCVRATGHTILDGIDLSIRPGAHLAIVGLSGSGKSSLVGLLLGWHKPSSGHLLVDGEPLDGIRLERLRRETAWVDPSVQIWNRSLMENLRYGSSDGRGLAMRHAIERADLSGLLQRLPRGFQTRLGEGGGLLSGGEGQRVRLGRALLRPAVRLAILDEAFRGTERHVRRELLSRAREAWRNATLLCITHDVAETRQFERVLVVEGGRITEDGAPDDLASADGSRYRSLLDAEEEVRAGLWAGDGWRRLRLEGGRLSEDGGEAHA